MAPPPAPRLPWMYDTPTPCSAETAQLCLPPSLCACSSGPSACPIPCPRCSQWRLLAILGQCWLGRKYLRLVREDGSEDRHRLLSRTGRWQQCFEQRFVCTGERSPLKKPGECGAVLCDTRAVLSREVRCRAAGASPMPPSRWACGVRQLRGRGGRRSLSAAACRAIMYVWCLPARRQLRAAPGH